MVKYIGYHFAPTSWGQGYATEATRELINYLFNNTTFENISATVLKSNESSQNVLSKIGFHKITNPEFEDKQYDYYSISRSEFFNL